MLVGNEDSVGANHKARTLASGGTLPSRLPSLALCPVLGVWQKLSLQNHHAGSCFFEDLDLRLLE